jgi:hypothetical protein
MLDIRCCVCGHSMFAAMYWKLREEIFKMRFLTIGERVTQIHAVHLQVNETSHHSQNEGLKVIVRISK